MLTKKDYEAIARIIKTRVNKYYTQEHYDAANGIESLSWDLADYFNEDNPRFDEGKFLDTCGLGD